MSRRPVLEDVGDDDIDNMDMDIAEFDPSLRTPIAPARAAPTITRSQDLEPQEPSMFPNLADLAQMGNQEGIEPSKGNDILKSDKFTDEEREQISKFQIIYPCYFDKNRSHKEGRRVSVDKAVENPLAYTISNACRKLQIPVLLELDKNHPQDFGNPGRVRVLVKEDGSPQGEFKNKRSLFNAIADYLKSNPTTLQTIDPKGSMPCPSEYEQDFTPEEIPRVKGFKMNTIVPIHSNLTMKHPMTKSIYDQKAPAQPIAGENTPKAPKQKKKIMKIRG